MDELNKEFIEAVENALTLHCEAWQPFGLVSTLDLTELHRQFESDWKWLHPTPTFTSELLCQNEAIVLVLPQPNCAVKLQWLCRVIHRSESIRSSKIVELAHLFENAALSSPGHKERLKWTKMHWDRLFESMNTLYERLYIFARRYEIARVFVCFSGAESCLRNLPWACLLSAESHAEVVFVRLISIQQFVRVRMNQSRRVSQHERLRR